MAEMLRAGTRPTDILRELLSRNPEFDNYELSERFRDEFPDIDGHGVQSIWYWKRPGSSRGVMPDNELDSILSHWLTKAGYLSSSGPESPEQSCA